LEIQADILTFGHFFNCGDLISALPGFKKVFEKQGIKTKIYQKLGLPAFYYNHADHPIMNGDGTNITMDWATYNMMKPLIEYQKYIESFEIWDGQEVIMNSLGTRDSRLMPVPNAPLQYWMFFIFPQLSCDVSKRWIDVPFSKTDYSGKIIVNRTRRYTNPYISYAFLKPHEDDILFAGTEDERYKFCEDFKLDLKLLRINNFLELAQAINTCRFFLGNQSFCFWIADALKKKRILEICQSFPNTFPIGKDGHAFIHQKPLELYFDEFLADEKETGKSNIGIS